MNKNDQQQLLIQLIAENQELLEFKILNNLISKSMQALTENIDQAMPFSVLFSPGQDRERFSNNNLSI
ncbi:hypothetical protein FJD32_011160 [Shewanella sp. LC6]|uniref:hypothetical protein n=1 Tax=unclassified Shewanella TaxID=196818 RepID=UPI00112648C5|nr:MULTISPECIES: hypothetical protein [unclassified Shewanella]QQK60012.1 hypothetical protein FJD32_011160 [Shewanella sp. LC6]TPE63078.1 hypothetical protein FJD33_04665 [Shewanella sp. LC2]